MSFFDELKRRNVFRVAVAYIIVAWLTIQVIDVLVPMLDLPEYLGRALVLILLAGFPIALLFAWAFELTPGGLKKESDVDRSQSVTPDTGRKLDRMIIVVLVIAVLAFSVDKFVLAPDVISTALVEQQTQDLVQSIAVLPFVNMSSDKEQEYFSDGLSEELLNLLTKIPELRVTSRSSAFSYKGKDFKISDVGRELNVNHVLEGSVRKSGDKIRITAQLVQVQDDVHVWSETWDRTLDDVFAIQDEIALAVVEALKIKLLDAAPKSATTTGEAYALYLEGRYLIIGRQVAGFLRAESLLKQALELDPGYAPAWEGLANVYARGRRISVWPVSDANNMAREAAEKALAIDPTNGKAHAVLADIAELNGKGHDESELHLRKAMLLSPGDPDVIFRAAEISLRIGDYNECLHLANESVAQDPLNFTIYTVIGYCHMLLGQFDDAIVAFNKRIGANPDAVAAYYYLSNALLANGDHEAALSAIKKERDVEFNLTGLALVNHALGNKEESDAALVALIAGDNGQYNYQIAVIYAYRDEVSEAIAWLRRANDNDDTGMMLILGDPMLDNVRDDPRFVAFLTELGLEPIN